MAWWILAGTLEYRTAKLEDSLSGEVNSLWGPADLVQWAPWATTVGVRSSQPNGGDVEGPEKSDISVSFGHDNRYKGLLWFSTYTVDFAGTYQIRCDPVGDDGNTASFVFEFPEGMNFLEDLSVVVDGEEQGDVYTRGRKNSLHVPFPADGRTHTVEVNYKTRGRDSWQYSSAWRGQMSPAAVKNFSLVARTDFKEIDYPKGSISPSSPAEETDRGMLVAWKYLDVHSTHSMGIQMPGKTNAGPIAARMSFFAPVSLFFFFAVLFTVAILRKIPLHPMQYMFTAAGFFAFHILLAYLVDIVHIHAVFWICAAVSMLLVVSYMRLVAGVRFSLLYVGAAQLIYLVGFSYAFFWEGRTGLTVTIGAIATLFVLMQATGRVDWAQVFRRIEQGGTRPHRALGGITGGPPPAPIQGDPDESEG